MTDLTGVPGNATAADGARSFALRGTFRAFLVFFYVFAAFVGVMFARSALAEQDLGGLVFLVGWVVLLVCQALLMILRMPWRIELGERSIGFVGLTGSRREIPYSELRSVRPMPFDLNRQSARWRSEQVSVWSVTAFRGWRSLLNEVERRAPQAEID